MTNQNHNETPQSSQIVHLAEFGDQAEPSPQTHPLKRLHLLLRGRYHWAILLGAIGLIAGGFLGWTHKDPVYQSTGMIRVRPVVPVILYKSEDSGVMPMFRAFVDSQAQLMQSPRVLSMAMESEAWRQFERGLSPQAQAEFRQKLSVRRASGEILAVSFTDDDREAANAAVKAVIQAYMRIYGERDVREEAQRLRILEERRTALSNQLDSLRTRIRRIADEFGSDALEQMYQFNLQELQKLESALKQAELEVAAAGAAEERRQAEAEANGELEGTAAMDEPTGPDPDTMTAEEIAEYDRQVSQLWQRKQSLESSIEELKFRFGKDHRQVTSAQMQLVGVLRQMKERVAWFKENRTAEDLATASPIKPGSPRFTAEADPEFLHQRVEQLKDLHSEAREETLALGRKNLEIDGLKEESQRIKERLEETRFRIEQLNVESSVSGRLEVISEGDLSPSPVNQGKRKQLAVLGAGACGSVGVGLILLLGFMDRRLYDSGDAGMSSGNVRLLGILPELPNDLTDPEQARVAGYCVHHIRTLLQISGEAAPRVIAVTSGAGGSGKTSLTLSLGLSYASSGARTLLIDADLIGSGLTRRLEAIKRRRIGQILRQHGLITDEQLEHALKLAQNTGDRLGACLVEMGVLTTGEIDHALSLQETTPVGLLDTLEGEPLEDCVAETGIPGVEVLPVGGATGQDTSRLSPATMDRLLNRAAEAYDIVLVDTGPVPGSIESSIVAAAADAVVPIFARGENRTGADRCVEFLQSINAHLAGVVFNRATERDLQRSSLSSSLSKRDDGQSPHGGNGQDQADTQRATRYGPVAQAVARSSRHR